MTVIASIFFPWIAGALAGIGLAALIIAVDLYLRQRSPSVQWTREQVGNCDTFCPNPKDWVE